MIRSRLAALVLASAAGLASSALADQPGSSIAPDLRKAAEEVQKTTKKVTDAVSDANIRAQAEDLIAKAEKYLRDRQDKATGGWSIPTPNKDGQTQPHLPGITALVLNGMLLDPKADAVKDSNIAMGIKYLLNYQQEDGGVHDKMLPSYNTALAISVFARANTPQTRDAMQKALPFLRTLQYGEHSEPTAAGGDVPKPVTKDHPFYGGVGYGKHGRPDNSNLQFFMQALKDAGVSPDDPAVKRALVFLGRTQMDDRINEMPYAKGSRQGGHVYATAENAQSVDSRPGQSQAGTIEETLSDGTKASRLRAYGSMTYAGFKSYAYAELPKDDLRVKAAWDWICRNYTVDENPGVGSDGQYYYYLVFSRALRASNQSVVKTLTADNTPTGQERNWRADLITKLATLQQPDGSFKSIDDRWMENNPELITAYALIALREAIAE